MKVFVTTIDLGELAEAELDMLDNSFRACNALSYSMTGCEFLAKVCMQLTQLIEREQKRRKLVGMAKENFPGAKSSLVSLEVETETAPHVAAAVSALGISTRQLPHLGLGPSSVTDRCAELCERIAADIRSTLEAGSEIH